MVVLGIETSCDETSVAVIVNDELKSNVIFSQDFHKKYGGVVPELSSRAHLQQIQPLLELALEESSISLNDVDIVTATAGPGLIGALLVGLSFGKALAYTLQKPFVPVNHIEGHLFSGFLMPVQPQYPILGLIVSGGHTLLMLVESPTRIIKLGSTIDDAAGEAFDKVAKLLGLGYPGGPKIQKLATQGNAEAFQFPIAEVSGFNFSFSGLKTAVLRHTQKLGDAIKQEEIIADTAASFQHAVVTALKRKTEKAIKQFRPKSLTLAGGVAANSAVRDMIVTLATKHRIQVVIPGIEFCGDNAAMIAKRGELLYNAGERFGYNVTGYPSFQSKYVNDFEPEQRT